jgi:hypothetical protein
MEAKFVSIEDIRSTLDRLRQDPNTKRRFPRELWDSIIHLTKTYPIEEVCRRLDILPAYLKDKMHQFKEQVLAFHEIPIPVPLSFPDTITIELSTTTGLKAKIQGPPSCLNCLFKLFGR